MENNESGSQDNVQGDEQVPPGDTQSLLFESPDYASTRRGTQVMPTDISMLTDLIVQKFGTLGDTVEQLKEQIKVSNGRFTEEINDMKTAIQSFKQQMVTKDTLRDIINNKIIQDQLRDTIEKSEKEEIQNFENENMAIFENKNVVNFKIIENSDEKPEIKKVEEQIDENIKMNHHNFKIMENLKENKPKKKNENLIIEVEVMKNYNKTKPKENERDKQEEEQDEEQVEENKTMNQYNFKIMENLKENKPEKENKNLINELEVMKNYNKTKPVENESDKQEEEQDEEQKIQIMDKTKGGPAAPTPGQISLKINKLNILVVFGFFSKHPPSPRIVLWKYIRWKEIF